MSASRHLPDANDDEALSRLLVELLPAGAMGAVGRIAPGNESLLTPVEAESLDRAVTRVRRASGTARRLARELCALLGVEAADIPRSRSGAPVWPAGLIGSLTHDSSMAAVIVARSCSFGGVGVDIEPSEPIGDDVVGLVVRDEENRGLRHDPVGGKLLFSIKEAVFKAVHPHDGIFLDFKDVTVDIESRTAQTRYGRRVHWRAHTWPRILVVAWW